MAPGSSVPTPGTAVTAHPTPGSDDELQARLARYAEQAEGAFSPATERAIRADTAVFGTWCREQGLSSLPATEDTLAMFVTAMAATRKPATVRRYASSIAHLHRAAGLPSPTEGNAVRLALKRQAREQGTAQQQAEGLTRRLVDRMLDNPRQDARSLRNKALLAVAYDTMARRSELVALRLEDVMVGSDGHATVTIRRSKTDQEGEGADCYLAPDTMGFVRRWLAAAGITDGLLFRAVLKGGQLGGELGAKEVPRVFKEMATAAGAPPELVARISGHSSRIGAAQDMAASDRISLPAIMQAGRWKAPAMVARYTRRQATRQSGSAKLAELQNRT